MAFGFPSFRQPANVTYGTGSVKALAGGDWSDTVLCLSGAPEVRAYLQQAWAKAGPALETVRTLVKPAGEPTWEATSAAATSLRAHAPRRLVVVGGGSVLDWARLAWLSSVDALDGTGRLTDGWQARRREVELVLVPTTSGSGAEAATVAVLLVEGRKVPVVSPALLADRVVLDSRFLASVSAFTEACSIADTLSHAIEAWLSIVPGRLPRESAVGSLRLVLDEGASYDRHARLMDAGFLGGVAAAHCSVGIVHAFAHAMAAVGVGHGHGNALGLVAGLRQLLALPVAQALLTAVNRDAEALAARVQTLVQPALSDPRTATALAALDDPTRRRAIRDAMQADACLRTCPIPAADLDLDAWLDRVRDGAGVQC